MDILSRLRYKALGWWHDLPLPTDQTGTTPILQFWHGFDQASDKWIPLSSISGSPGTDRNPREYSNLAEGLKFVLATWNIDASSSGPEARISALLSHIQNMTTPPDIIFLQEVSRPALWTILDISWIRKHWYSSEADTTSWGKQAFASMTLMSRSRFNNPVSANHMATIGPVWRVKYPSRFERDALCCDILLPSLDLTQDVSRIRLINAHLDSLPILPSLRPRQLPIIAAYLRAVGHGLVAGDFNSVLPEDETLVSENSLMDAWTELHPNEDGITWGFDSDTPFPPRRMDKVALAGLRVSDIQVIRPEGKEEYEGGPQVPWSDHSGLVCSFTL